MKSIKKRLQSVDSIAWFAIVTFAVVLVVLGLIIFSALDNQVLFALLLVLLAAWLAQVFSIIQTSKRSKEDSARLVDSYRSSLVRAGVICLDNFVAIQANLQQFHHLRGELQKGRFFTIKTLSYQKIDTSNFVNNNIYSSCVSLSQSLTLLKLNEELLEAINSDTTRIAHLIKMSGQKIDTDITDIDRNLIKLACTENIKILEGQQKQVEDLYNEINLHVDNLDYELYLKNPNEVIRRALFYAPSKEEIASPTERTENQLAIARSKYGFSKQRV